MRRLKRRVRDWSDAVAGRVLGVEIDRDPASGRDPHAAVRALRAWSPGDVIFDVGACDGRTLARLLTRFPSPRVFAFEPVPRAFDRLREEGGRFENVHCLRLALGSEAGRREIYVHDVISTSSFRRDWSEPVGKETVEVSTVDQVMLDHEIEFLHFLKIDTEGHELEVLQGAREALASARVAIVQVEVGMDAAVSPHTSFHEVQRTLATFGYFLHGIFTQARDTRGVRPPASWSETQRAGYRPSVIKFCDAVFAAADLGDRALRA